MVNDNFSIVKNNDRKNVLREKFMEYLFYLNNFEYLQYFLIYLGAIFVVLACNSII